MIPFADSKYVLNAKSAYEVNKVLIQNRKLQLMQFYVKCRQFTLIQD